MRPVFWSDSAPKMWFMGTMSEALKQKLVKNETKKSYKHLDHSGSFKRSFKGWMHLKIFFKHLTRHEYLHTDSECHAATKNFSHQVPIFQTFAPWTSVSSSHNCLSSNDELLICVSQPALFDKWDTNYLKDNSKVSPISWTSCSCWSAFSDGACWTVTRNPVCFRYFVLLCFCPHKLCHGWCDYQNILHSTISHFHVVYSRPSVKNLNNLLKTRHLISIQPARIWQSASSHKGDVLATSSVPA